VIDFIYTLFIAPLEYWMRVVLVWGHGVCEGNWGWAIVLMSFVVNTVILPIYMKAESWQEQEQRLRLGFEAKEAMIKRAFTGQERFAMISTMRRQAGYTAFLSMRSSVGFFLQIPFFFAAYHFLSHFDPLSGVSFLGLADLGKPDEALHIGSFAVNVMPILMTVINIGSALIYTKNLGKRDKIQLYVMAGLFLVLLYDAASGLVLYWTCNNIYSLAKNIVYDVVRKLAPVVRALPLRVVRVNPSRETISWTGIAPLILWFVGATLGTLSSTQFEQIDGMARRVLEITSGGFYIASVLMCAVQGALLLTVRGRRLFALFILLLCANCLWYWYKGTFVRARVFFTFLTGLFSLIPVLSLTLDRYRPEVWLYPKIDPSSLYTPSAFWLVVLLCNYLPVQAYCTAPEIFSSPDVVLAKLLILSAVFGAILYAAGRLWIALGVMRTASVLTAFVALWLTLYAFVLPLDVGSIDGFQIEHPERLYRPVNVATDVLVLVGLGSVFYQCLKRGAVSVVRVALVCACVLSVVSGIEQLWSTQGRWQEDTQSRRTELPAYNESMLGFTKHGKNTLVFVLDMFSGRHMPEIVRDNPELKDKFSGFVWYPDTLAQGRRTTTSIATLLCGEACTVGALNQGERDSLVEKINRRYAQALRVFGEKTDFFVNEHTWLESQRFSRYAGKNALAVRFLSSAYLNRYAQKHKLEITVGASDDFLQAVSLFSASPWTFKWVIYFDGHWVTQAIGYWTSDRVANRLQEWAFLDQLPEISNARATHDTYKFFHSEITHNPWLMVPGKCGIIRELAPGKNYPQQAVEACSLKALASWFDWMKKVGVYDNTTIVIASDHGAYGMRLNPLLLVKPRNAALEPLRSDDSRMSLTDVPALAAGTFVMPGKDRIRYTYEMDKNTEDRYKGARRYRVTGPVLNPKSWPADFPRDDIPR